MGMSSWMSTGFTSTKRVTFAGGTVPPTRSWPSSEPRCGTTTALGA
jgi:hypothetical protein